VYTPRIQINDVCVSEIAVATGRRLSIVELLVRAVQSHVTPSSAVMPL